MSSRCSSSLPATGGWMPNATIVEPGGAHRGGERAELVAGRAEAAHRRRQLDDDAAGPAGEGVHVVQRTDGEDDRRVGRRVARRRQHRGGDPGRDVIELVDRADGDRVRQLGGDGGQRAAPEPVAVALDDGDDAGQRPGDVLDVGVPRVGVDGQPHGHRSATVLAQARRRMAAGSAVGRLPGPRREPRAQRSGLALGEHALPQPGAVGEVVDEPRDAAAQQRRHDGHRGQPTDALGDDGAGDDAPATRRGGRRRRGGARRTGARARRA